MRGWEEAGTQAGPLQDPPLAELGPNERRTCSQASRDVPYSEIGSQNDKARKQHQLQFDAQISAKPVIADSFVRRWPAGCISCCGRPNSDMARVRKLGYTEVCVWRSLRPKPRKNLWLDVGTSSPKRFIDLLILTGANNSDSCALYSTFGASSSLSTPHTGVQRLPAAEGAVSSDFTAYRAICLLHAVICKYGNETVACVGCQRLDC